MCFRPPTAEAGETVCPHCYTVIKPDADGRCPECGGIMKQSSDTPAPAAPKPPAPATPTSAVPQPPAAPGLH